MYRLSIDGAPDPAGASLHFESSDVWRAHSRPRSPVNVLGVTIGDDERGPLVYFAETAPGSEVPDAPAHAHASDSWRISLRGTFPMGKRVYEVGDFRFQRGWRTYPSDNVSQGSDGGWMMLVFADRRGTRARYTDPTLVAHSGRETLQHLGVKGDVTSADPADVSGPSALAVSAGTLSNAGFRNGSLGDLADFESDGHGTHALAALLGDPVCGPVLSIVVTEPGVQSQPTSDVDTDVLRVVLDGSCRSGDHELTPGHIRVQPANTPSEAMIAGPDGLAEVILFGDRRGLKPVPPASRGWPALLHKLVPPLEEQLLAGASASSGQHGPPT